jgi:hypothetical protein
MYCRETGDEATAHVARLPALRRYFASYTRATDRSLELLATVDTLEEVTLDSVAALTDAGLAALSRLPNLRAVAASGMIGVTPQVRRAFGPGVRVRLE